MSTPAKRFIPEGYHALTPYLMLKDAAATMEFYKKVFGASELIRMPGPGGRVAHAEMKIGDSIFMMAEEHSADGLKSPKSLGGSPAGFMIYVENCDQVVHQALIAGAQLERPLADQFYGDRSATILDPSGHKWTVATHKEDVSPEEMDQRMRAMAKSSG